MWMEYHGTEKVGIFTIILLKKFSNNILDLPYYTYKPDLDWFLLRELFTVDKTSIGSPFLRLVVS